jgi:hypothetical protein
MKKKNDVFFFFATPFMFKHKKNYENTFLDKGPIQGPRHRSLPVVEVADSDVAWTCSRHWG